MRHILARRRPLAVVAASSVLAGLVVWTPAGPPAADAQAADVVLDKSMPGETLYGDTTAVTLTASNPADGGADGFNTSFRDVLPPGTSLDNASPPPSQVLPQGDGGPTVVVWENVADLQDGATVSISYDLVHGTDVYAIGDTITNDASAYTSADARLVPDFDSETGEATGDFDASASDSATTDLIPFQLTKSEPGTEAELLRGVDDQQTVYELTVQNNHRVATDALVVDDHLPAGLEFLGCGGTDNTSSGEEYPGSGPITSAPVADCFEPSLVETVETDPDGPLPFGVYTHVRWTAADLGNPTLSTGDAITIPYLAAVPLRENAPFADPAPPTDGAQTANLDNNTGALTTDEQSLVNGAVVAGTTGGTPYDDDATFEVTAEDISLHKSGSPGLAQGQSNAWELLVETSEYVTDSGPVTVTDTVPDGLTVTGASDGGTYAENPDGTWTVTWELASVPAPNGTRTLTLTTTTDEAYTTRGGGAPVAANDSVANSAELQAPSMTIIDGNGGTTSSFAHPDASSTSISGVGIRTSKQVAAPATPMGTPVDCYDGTAETWVDLAESYTPGDRVCWRLEVSFPDFLDTPNVEVTDLLPDGYAFEEARTTSGPTPTTEPAPGDEPNLVWTFDNVEPGQTWVGVVSTILEDNSAVTSGDLTSNLLKVTHENTDGAVFQFRDDADAEAVEPQLGLTKSVADVDGDTTGLPADSAAVQGGDVVTFQVVVSNDGGRDAVDTEVWDLLPDGLDCATVVDASLTDGGSCDDTVDPDRITWGGLTVPAGGAVTLTYDVAVPADVSPAEAYVDDAGVRTYDATTNTGTPFTYVPEGNVDPTVDPNTDAARDTAEVTTPAVVVDKDAATSIVDGAAGNTNGEATIGELVDYTVTATIPAGTTLDAPAGEAVELVDVVPGSLTIVGTPTASIDPGAGPVPTPPAVDVSGQTITVTLSPVDGSYVNAPDSGDDVVTLTFRGRVDDAAGVARNTRIRNAATLTYADLGGDTVDVSSPNVDTRVVEPNLSVTKDEDDADDVVAAGDTLTYTVTVRNGTGNRDSSAHDVVVVDTVPEQLTPQVDGSSAVSSGGVWDAGARTITWTSAEVPALAEVQPGDVIPLAYDAQVADPLTGSSELTNTVEVTGTSLPGGDAYERTEGSGYAATASDTVTGNPLDIAKRADVAEATIGEPITYTVDVTVPADTRFFDVTVLDDLPAGVTYVETLSASCDTCTPDITVAELGEDAGHVGWFLGDLGEAPAARVVTIAYRVHVDTDAGAGDTLANLANVFSNQTDTITGTPVTTPAPDDFDNAQEPVSTDVAVQEPDVTIDKSVDPTSAEPGDTLTYTLEVSNAAGPDVSTAYDVVVTDVAGDDQFATVTTSTTDLPAGVTATGGASAPFEWTIDALAPGATITLTYTATLDPSSSLRDADVLDNTAVADHWTSIDTDDPPAGSGPARTYGPIDARVQVDLGFPALTYDKAVGAQGTGAAVDTSFTWVLTLENDGDADARNVDVVDTLPANWTYDAGSAVVRVDGSVVDAAPTPTVGTGDPAVLTWDDVVPALAPGEVLTITFTATPTLDAQDDAGTGDAVPHTNQVAATAEDAAGATGNADGAYGRNAVDDSTDPATADAYLPEPGSVGDTAWVDLDGDGERDAGWETDQGGIGGVTVTLTNVDTGTELTTATAADGTYLFTDVPPGTWTVTVDTSDPQFPADLVPTFDADGTDTAHTSEVTLPAGGEDLDQDFGYRGTGTIGDTVWLDLDRDGTQDGLEPGIEGVTVTLRDAHGNVVATTTTDADGQYAFTDVPDGDWTIEVTPPADVDPTADADGTDTPNTSDVALADGSRTNLDQDFGYAGDLSIGDTVWYDLDGDGTQDAGWETDHGGIAGITVTLRDADGTAVAETTTDADGRYRFDNLPPGEWTVVVSVDEIPGTVEPTVDADGPTTPHASTTTLEDVDDLDQDFGYRGTGSIGDTVWLDLDRDGTVNGDEPGLAGWTVTLTDADGDVVATTATGANGGYLFDDLPPGEWTVTVTPEPGYEPTFDADGTATAGTSTVVLADGEANRDQDFGWAGTGSIGDRVWVDLDGDGVQDALEPGLSDVAVQLELDGEVVATTTTDDDGGYLFEHLPPGDYTVVVQTGTLPPDYEPTNDPDEDGTPHEADVTLGIGDSDLDQDFGYNGDGQLGDRIWLDRDADGEQDAGEPGIAGVTVELVDADGDVVATTATDADGGYLFGGLLDGEWTVQVLTDTLPDGVTQTADADGLGTPDQSTTTLSDAAPVDLDQDFGYVGDLAIGDTLWLDLDEDGAQGELEPGTPDVTVQLVDTVTGTVVAETVTDADGVYGFEALDPRDWTVVVDTSTLPEGLAPTADADGVDTPDESTTTLVDADDLEQDFGYAGDLAIGDTLWFDVDADGELDEVEPGLGDVAVHLLDADGTVVATTTTDADGTYRFDNLPPGEWTVVVDDTTLPPGLRPTVDADGVETPHTSTTTLVDADDLDQDFGWTGTSSLGDRVWFDDDLDGIQDDDEASAPDVVVNLYAADDRDTVIATTTTDEDGRYRFPNLRPGDHMVEVVPADGVAITPAVDSGDDDVVDSDVDPATGRTAPVTVPADTDVDTVDAGVVELGTIGDLVFDDRDGDATRDEGEPGVPDVAVALLDGEGDEVATTTTDEDGQYRFEDLLPGEYTVVFELPEGSEWTTPDAGDDDAVDSDVDPQTGTSSTVDLSPGEVDVSIDAGLRRQAELEVTKELEGDLEVGGEATYLVTVRNLGPNVVPGTVTVVDDVPSGLTWLRADGDGWTCDMDGGDVVCQHQGPLPVGEVLAVRLVFAVEAGEGEVVTNTVGVLAGGVALPEGDDPVGAVSGDDPVQPAPTVPGTDIPLPRTGAGVTVLLLLAGALLAAGAWMLRAVGRRRLA